MKRRYQVFVSSTFADLIDERQKILHTLVELGCFPAGMEFFPAASLDAWSYIASIIDDSDYYVLVVGGRYGSLTPEGVSFTQAEYEYAVTSKPVMVFLHTDPDSLPVRRSDLDAEARRKLAEFRSILEERHLCKYWTSPDDLAGAVARSLAVAFESEPGVGWTRPGDTRIESDFRRSSGFEVVKHSELLRLRETGFEDDLNLSIRAAHPGLEVFYRQVYKVGGTRFLDAEVSSPNLTLLRPMLDTGNATRYWVHLGRQLLRGEEVLVPIRETYVEDRRDRNNMHAYGVNHPVGDLELLLEYDASRAPVSAVWREYMTDPETGDVLDGGNLEVDPRGGVLAFRRSRPTVGHAYSIEWLEDV